MRLRGLGTRRRPCAAGLSTHMGTPCLAGGGQERRQSVGVLKEVTAERTAPPAGVEGDYLRLESLHSDAYVHFFAIPGSVKNPPCFV